MGNDICCKSDENNYHTTEVSYNVNEDNNNFNNYNTEYNNSIPNTNQISEREQFNEDNQKVKSYPKPNNVKYNFKISIGSYTEGKLNEKGINITPNLTESNIEDNGNISDLYKETIKNSNLQPSQEPDSQIEKQGKSIESVIQEYRLNKENYLKIEKIERRHFILLNKQLLLSHFMNCLLKNDHLSDYEKEIEQFDKSLLIFDSGSVDEYAFDNQPISIYIGERDKDNNSKKGFGQLIYKDGSYIYGLWKENIFLYGRKVKNTSIDYIKIQESMFINHQSEGHGIEKVIHIHMTNNMIETSEEVSSYEGMYKNGNKSGQGRFVKDDEEYDGQFLNNEKSGQGRVLYRKTGNVYNGGFIKNELSGNGLYIFSNGDEYVGQFRNGKFNGEGRYKWKTGDVYEGEYVDGKRNGKGRLIYNSGKKVFIGDFVDNCPYGKGKLINGNVVLDVEYNKGVKKLIEPSRSLINN